MTRTRLVSGGLLVLIVGLVLVLLSPRPVEAPDARATGSPGPTRSTGSTGSTGSTESTPSLSPPQSPGSSSEPEGVTLVGAGDIASCASNGDEATAALLDTIGGTVFTLGDNVYDDGTATEFAECYGPSWGRSAIRDRTRPVPGNHDYRTRNASGYFDYFGAAAGDPATGYYAYDAGAWRVYVLNSNCAAVDGCVAGSSQERWLRADLAESSSACTVAMWHHPLFSSGEHGGSTETKALYQALYEFNAELVLVGHDHDYERFAPQTPSGMLDETDGIVQIVAGTGGRSHYEFRTDEPNSLVRNSDTFGVLRLRLFPGAYEFRFIPVAGRSFEDSGGGACR